MLINTNFIDWPSNDLWIKEDKKIIPLGHQKLHYTYIIIYSLSSSRNSCFYGLKLVFKKCCSWTHCDMIKRTRDLRWWERTLLLWLTCCWLLSGLRRFWQADSIAWKARANWDWSTRPGLPAVLEGSEIPTKYADWKQK